MLKGREKVGMPHEVSEHKASGLQHKMTHKTIQISTPQRHKTKIMLVASPIGIVLIRLVRRERIV